MDRASYRNDVRYRYRVGERPDPPDEQLLGEWRDTNGQRVALSAPLPPLTTRDRRPKWKRDGRAAPKKKKKKKAAPRRAGQDEDLRQQRATERANKAREDAEKAAHKARVIASVKRCVCEHAYNEEAYEERLSRCAVRGCPGAYMSEDVELLEFKDWFA